MPRRLPLSMLFRFSVIHFAENQHPQQCSANFLFRPRNRNCVRIRENTRKIEVIVYQNVWCSLPEDILDLLAT